MKIIEGGVTAAKGFEAAATAAGIKYQGRTDMAIIYSEKPCKVAGTFTTNVVKAAPVKWDRQIVESKQKSQAVIVNSGIANACTGEEGMKYCEETAKEAGKVLGLDENIYGRRYRSNDRRNGERFRNDPSEYVYNACIYYNGCKNFQKSTSGGNEQ